MPQNNDYDKLLSNFEDNSKKAPINAPKRRTPAYQPTRQNQPGGNTPPYQATPQRRVPMEDISSDSSRDNNGIKSGVYFSNPPKEISKQAAREKGVMINPETKRKANKRTEALKKSSEQKQKNKSQKLKNIGIMVGVIAVVSLILCVYGIGCINDVLALSPKNTTAEVYVEKGMTDSDVIDILHDEKLINNKLFCKIFIKFFEKDGDYVSGVFTLNSKDGVEKMIAIMKTDYTSAETVSLTFPEGWTIEQMGEKLEANGVCTASSFISTIKNVDFSDEYDFIEKIPNKEKRFVMLEGYMYPDTYEFYKGENASSVVRRFLDNFDNRWTEEYQKKADELGMSVDEVIIFASILQEEAASAEQMPTIASVLYNRLDKPNAFPLLQCDSTEDYLLNSIKPNLTSTTEDQQKYLEYRDNYDTYSEACKGLPIGAIANPGDDAINATLNPDETSYLYFRHDKKGKVYYAESFSEHEANGKIAAKVKADD